MDPHCSRAMGILECPISNFTLAFEADCTLVLSRLAYLFVPGHGSHASRALGLLERLISNCTLALEADCTLVMSRLAYLVAPGHATASLNGRFENVRRRAQFQGLLF